MPKKIGPFAHKIIVDNECNMSKSFQINAGDTALLVIDVQQALFTRPNPIYNASQLIITINSLVNRSHLRGIPVVYVQHSNKTLLKKGTPGWQIHPDLNPLKTDLLIHKTQGNAFLDTSLQYELESHEVKNLLITGLVTHQCIRATCLGGLELGYRVFLVEGGHSNFRQDAANVIEMWQLELEKAGVLIASPDSIAFC